MAKDNGLRQIVNTVSHSKRLHSLIFLMVVLGLILGVSIVPLESRSGRGGNILSVEDGLWWAITTITGVGFGDVYPVTTTGRLVGAFLEVFGVVLFGAVIAFISISLIRFQEEYYVRRIMDRVDGLEAKIDNLRKRIEYLIKEQ